MMLSRLGGVAAFVTAVLVSGVAGAQTATDRSASILIFPKVIADGTRDTLVQISNQSNSVVTAHCFYVNGAPLFPELPPGPGNEPLWQVTDFNILLTKQQPTMWLASAGRSVDPSDPPCQLFTGDFDCYGAGFDPGGIPALPAGFTGHLTCVEVDLGGSPISGNHLIGNATVKDLASGDVSRHSAVGLAGNEINDGDGVLCLGGGSSATCPGGAEYEGCPQTWIVGHRPEASSLAAVGPGSEVSTHLTVLPCAQNFDAVFPASVTLQYFVINEFEQQLSGASSTTCWSDESLTEINPFIFASSALATASAQTRVRPSSSSASGIVVLAEEFRSLTATGTTAAAAANAYAEGTRPDADLITLPSF